MPLIILGLVVVIGIVIYALLMYARSGDEDDRPVRERYSHAFPPKRPSGDHEDSKDAEGNHTMYFPSDAEVEKRKRNIH